MDRVAGRHARQLCLALALLAAPAGAAEPAPAPAAAPSADVAAMAERVRAAGDNAGQGYVIVDKRNARAFAYDADGSLRGAAPVLLGLARGDVNPPGIGDRPLSAIGPADRITAAGRYVARLGNDLGKNDILWVDYAASLSLHRVITGKPADQRVRRLMSPSPDDNRISYGCINVPADFFDSIVRPLFIGTTGIVYILPEQRAFDDVFPMLR
ncbi:L,D-transpeptidase [Sandarakinorhabdus sp. DWP1-3-1]|uniref:L,D-transpeptidase n=1 Tax=Sandarakinorhabdus sp. DWP1-3-1 TaxID=2804627 RepID=UPI003CEA2686